MIKKKKKKSSQGKYMILQSMITKMFGPIKHSGQNVSVLSLYLISPF